MSERSGNRCSLTCKCRTSCRTMLLFKISHFTLLPLHALLFLWKEPLWGKVSHRQKSNWCGKKPQPNNLQFNLRNAWCPSAPWQSASSLLLVFRKQPATPSVFCVYTLHVGPHLFKRWGPEVGSQESCPAVGVQRKIFPLWTAMLQRLLACSFVPLFSLCTSYCAHVT